MRGHLFFGSLALLCALASPVSAQTAPAEPAPAPTPPTALPAAIVAPPNVPVRPARNAPIVYVVLRDARVPDNVFAAVQTMGADALRPLILGRTLEPLTDGATFNACADNGCIGAELARANKSGGVIIRLSRARANGPVELRASAHDAGNGMMRGEAITASWSGADLSRPNATAVNAFIARVQPNLWPAPPPPPVILVAVNADGANVMIDNQAAGTTPLAPATTTAGRHVVAVSLAGYESTTRTVEAGETGVARLDIDLVPTAEMAERLAENRGNEVFAGAESAESEGISQPWYERWYVWAGAGAVVVAAVVIGVVVGTAETTYNPPQNATPIPGIQ